MAASESDQPAFRRLGDFEIVRELGRGGKQDPADGSVAVSSLENDHDGVYFFADSASQLVTCLLDLGPELLPGVCNLGLLIFSQIQVLVVGDSVGHPITYVLPALLLELLKLLLLALAQDFPNLLQLFPDQGSHLLADGLQFLLLLVGEV
jgi:hypothetical protein